MAIIYTYPVKTNPVANDLILISDSADNNKTKQVKVSTLPTAGGGSVSSVGFSLNSLAAFAITNDNPVTGSGTITLGINGSPSSGYLDYQGNWTNPTGSALPIEEEGSQITAAVAKINFTGTGATASASGNDVTVDIPAMSIQNSGAALICLLYTSPSPRDRTRSRMPSSA